MVKTKRTAKRSTSSKNIIKKDDRPPSRSSSELSFWKDVSPVSTQVQKLQALLIKMESRIKSDEVKIFQLENRANRYKELLALSCSLSTRVVSPIQFIFVKDEETPVEETPVIPD